MNADHDPPKGLIWATRGRSWGFRFLLNGGLPDPLLEYERVFANLKDEPAVWHREGSTVALRFPDPLGRRDAAGRVIPHEFVVFAKFDVEIDSVEDGRDKVWPRVAGAYAPVWDAERAPSVMDLRFTN